MKPVYSFLQFSTPFLLVFMSLGANQLSMVLQEAPLNVRQSVVKKLSKGKKITQAKLISQLPEASGIITLYGGYVDYSNPDGTIAFPLLHKEAKVYLVITPEVRPYIVHGKTISHLELVKGRPAKIYLFERKEVEIKKSASRFSFFSKNENKTMPIWSITEQKLPEDRQINQLSIILLTDPKNIVVKTGDSPIMSTPSPNFVLPSCVYVVGNVDAVKTLSEFMDLSIYFQNAEKEVKQGSAKKPEQSMVVN